MPKPRCKPWPPDPNQTASGKPGAVQTAELLGIRLETVKTRLHRARQLLRRDLEEQIGPVLADAFPFAGSRCRRLTEAVLERLGLS